MPIYAYECQSCGHSMEAIQKMSDAPLTECPACQQAALKKMLTAPAFRLSGSGWYETDFKKNNRKNIAGEKESSAGASGGCSGGGCAAPSADAS